MSAPTALAIVAHPDDIEFSMAGTLLLLKQNGFNLHFWNIANGCYGSMVHGKAEIVRIRAAEARASAERAGAVIHAAVCDDLAVLYTPEMIAKVAAVVRAVKPQIILTHPLADYMEDHMITARLAVTGAFIRAAPNYVSDPPHPPWAGDTVVYHAMPHGLRSPMREPVRPEIYVDIASVLAAKAELLALHKSQQEWLDATQGMSSMVQEMHRFAAAVGAMSGVYAHAEAFRRHLHYGFAAETADPLGEALEDKVWFDREDGA